MSRLWLTWFLAIVFFIVLGLFLDARAAPIYRAEGSGHVITLTDEPCALPNIKNLPARATWKDEKGKVWEACWGRFNNAAIFYVDDKTIQILSIDGFKRVTEI